MGRFTQDIYPARAVIVSADPAVTSAPVETRSQESPPAVPRVRTVLWLAASAVTVVVVRVALEAASLPPLTHHMSVHILLMNLLAPLLAHIAAGHYRGTGLSAFASGRCLAAATIAQLGLLWAVHIPSLLQASSQSPVVGLAVQGLLLTSALWFWLAVVAQSRCSRWRALLALLVTGKLFCLLAAILVFAPRQLYPAVAHAYTVPGNPSSLADQQLAGLLMVSICPLTYVFEAIVITARWLKELAFEAAVPPGRHG